MERYVREQIERTTDLQTVAVTPSLFRTVDGQQFPRADVVSLTREDAAAIGAAVGSGGTVSMVLTGDALVTTRADTTPHAARVVGTLADAVQQLAAPLASGRFFTDEDVGHDAPVTVISPALASQFSRGSAPSSLVGDTLLFQGQPRVVIGVLATGNDEARRPLAIMPIGTAKTALPPFGRRRGRSIGTSCSSSCRSRSRSRVSAA